MEKLKKYLKDSILKDLENHEGISEKAHFIFKNQKDLENYINFFYGLSEHKQRYLNTLNNFLHDKKYHKRRGRALGSQSKAMPDLIYHKLIDYVEAHFGEKQKLALEFEGIEGARGEDVVEIKEEDLNFNDHIVRIHNQKKDRWYQLPINHELENELHKFIEKHHKDIIDHHGFIFYSENPVQKNDHITQKYLKTIVHNVLDKLNLNKCYGVAEGGRKLWLYSLHSLRGHAATQVDIKSNHNLRAVQRLLDHQPNSANVTMLYLERDETEMEEILR